MEKELNILHYYHVLVRRKKLTGIIIGSIMLIAVVYIIFAPRIYKSTATLLPLGGQQSGYLSTLMAQTGLGNLLGGAEMGMSSSPILAVLQSHTLAKLVVEKLDLVSVYSKREGEPQTVESATGLLIDDMEFTPDAEIGTIKLSGKARSATMAASIVNTYIEKLAQYLSENELTTAKRKRLFVEKQLEKNKVLLLETGKELSEFYRTHQLSSRDPWLDVNVTINGAQAVVNPSSDINVDHPEIHKHKEELEAKLKEARIVKKVPQQVYLTFLQGYYELLSVITTTMTQEYELAKLNEAKEDITFQVIDPGQVPLGKYMPMTVLILIVAVMFSVFVAAFVAFFSEHIRILQQAKHDE